MSEESRLDRIAGLPREQRNAIVADIARRRGISLEEARRVIRTNWEFTARPKQLQPPGDWTYWWIRAGRGFGKTLSGAQWAKERGMEEGGRRIGVVAPTLGDCRATCFEGVTGLLSVLPNEALHGGSREAAWNKSLLELTLANGTIYKGFTSEEPDRLRGPQHHFVWGEEVSSWKDANTKTEDAMDTTWSNLKLGLRLGDHPRAVLTSTPKSNRLTKHLAGLAADGSLVMVIGSSYENRENLAESYWRVVVAPLEGTRTGRQEIEAEILEDVEGALWTRAMIDAVRVPLPAGWQRDERLRMEWAARMTKIVVGVDPNTTSGEAADNAGIVVCGLGEDRLGYVMDDRTQVRGGPRAWAATAVDAYHDWQADKIVAEVNNGGEMVDLTIRGYDPTVPVKTVSASRGKRTRAEPIAALYVSDEEREKEATIRHLGVFAELEDEMSTWTPSEESPGRMDACLAADTCVTTERGLVRIDQIEIGERVLTRQGWQRVLNAGLTNGRAPTLTVELADGRTLRGTAGHPVWVEGKGFRPIDALVCGDQCLTLRDTRLCGLRGFLTRDIWMRCLRARRAISRLPAAAAKNSSTVKSGGRSTGRSPKECISTTSMATRSITTSQIYWWSRLPNIARSMRLSFVKPGERRLIELAHSLPPGMGLRKGFSGIASMRDGRGPCGSPSRFAAPGACVLPSVTSPGKLTSASVAGSAQEQLLMPKAGTRYRLSVPSAVSRFRRTSIGRSPRLVLVPVVRVCGSLDEIPVYNLEVESVPEYFANGVLVHNCVWAFTELRVWRPPMRYGRGVVTEGEIPGVVELGDGLLDPY